MMNERPILLLTASGDQNIPFLDDLSQMATIVGGDSVSDFAAGSANAEVILNWSGSLTLLRDVFLITRHLRWIHSRSAGLEQTLFPELTQSQRSPADADCSQNTADHCPGIQAPHLIAEWAAPEHVAENSG